MVAAGMLLCSFEVHQSSCSSSQWTWYVAGVKEVLSTASFGTSLPDSDLAILIDWVYYHDVLARFTLRHWSGENTTIPSCPGTDVGTQLLPGDTPFPTNNHVSHSASPTLAILELLSMFCDTIPKKPYDDMSVEEVHNYKSFLMMLDWRLRVIPVSAMVIGTSEMTMIMELYQLAALVYLNRVSEDLLDQSARTQQQIDRAFSIFSELSSCERQFPLFILGCEARTDDQRAIVLDLIARTEKGTSSRPIIQVKILIHAMWAQDDLADQELNYWDKLSSIISACSIMPSLV